MGGASGNATGGASGNVTGGASGSATGGASGSATGGASGSVTGGASGSGMAGTAPMAGASGSDGIPDIRSCELLSDCALVPRTTCCLCGAPELDDLTAVNVRSATEYTRALCAVMPPCQCASYPNPNLVATCDSGTCVAIDIHEHAVSACTEDAGCRVRVTDCCECGASTSVTNLIAVGQTLGYEALVCPPMTLCPGCAPVYPSIVTAHCTAGHCGLVVSGP
jgi:hypothetical protein